MSPILFNEKGWQWLKKLLETERAIILCDENTSQCLAYLNTVCAATSDLSVIEIPAGEPNKNLKTCELVWYQLVEHVADRRTVLINLGGGVVTDLGGFVASTFMRGIRFIHIPTSVLGMVDASIGGKTGVDFGGLKNMVGLFSQPEAIIVDSDFLKTLPQRHYRNGLAEVLKHAFISNPSILNVMDAQQDEMIAQSIQVKLEVVQRDEFETGERKKLNFGHTIGHAIESHFLESDTEVLHGEAIAAGMIMEAWLSAQLTELSTSELNSITETVDAIFSRLNISIDDWNTIKSLMIHDKKNRDGSVRFVLLKSIGEAVIDRAVTEELLNGAFHFYTKK